MEELRKRGRVTPLMSQYRALKSKHPGAILLFRVGDFYETFEEDAIVASEVLNITLTRRSNGGASEVPLAGIPHHALDKYLPILIRAGHRVAVCDQLEDPKRAKGLVKRGVTELVTPGLVSSDNLLEEKHSCYLCSLHVSDEGLGLSFFDLSTGEFNLFQGSEAEVGRFLESFAPAEVLVAKGARRQVEEMFTLRAHVHMLEDWVYRFSYAEEKLKNHFGVRHLKGFGISDWPSGVVAAGSILQYLEDTQHGNLAHVRKIFRIEREDHVWLDACTLRHLELLQPNTAEGSSLYSVVDQTLTSMGARLLRQWLILPLRSKQKIERRLSIVAYFLERVEILDELRSHFKGLYDIARASSKIVSRRFLPRDFMRLRDTMQCIGQLSQILKAQKLPLVSQMGEALHGCEGLIERITVSLLDEPALSLSQGPVFRDEASAELEKLRSVRRGHQAVLEEIQRKEIKRTGIGSLKVMHNKVFGYYFEVRHAQKRSVPSDWIRKQTLVNAERYVSVELKEYEEKIVSSEEAMLLLEEQLYEDLLTFACTYVSALQENAALLSELDILLGFSLLAKEKNYVRPALFQDKRLCLHKGRHPVIEDVLPVGEGYVPNDLVLDGEKDQMWLVTGPNMSGKSAFLRQTALIVLMAQMGSFVPCEKAHIGLVDKVFTRVGASDNLSRGESTFMVEMSETASILNNIGGNSLVLLDEIGRGTSTYDGISVAWSVAEYLHAHPARPKTLFATHYHELGQLSEDLPRVKNYHVSVKELGDKVLFLRKLLPGSTTHSFGVHVARMAGVPREVVERAREILQFFEKERTSSSPTKGSGLKKPPLSQKAMF